VLLALAGLLLGGAYSLLRQGSSKPLAAVVGLLGLLAGASGLFWLA
jgi:xanthosine utilization system XapX-like protein